ncbi:hypothetical protein [uncultured Stenotrophomonas sp.]|uniref:hypothetical protein n=1 Tax=uncultured Stenotrophomonas sp. TaxID=165438 RepID=UPI0025E78F4C|nr:hypothetical protein [uncultured Stenotrophomonas sp.]
MDAITYGWPRTGRVALMLAAALAGCSSVKGGGERSPSSRLQLVTLKPEASAIWLTASATGTIKPVGECVYFVSASGSRTLALWPRSFELDRKAGVPVGVRSTTSGKRVAFGEAHTFGGGNMAVSPSSVAAPVPAGCSGPAMMLYFE